MSFEDRDPTTLPDAADPTGPCPRCGHVSTFTTAAGETLSLRTQIMDSGGSGILLVDSERVIALHCAYCTERFAVIEVRDDESDRLRGVSWWPPPGAGQISDTVPANVGSAYDEGMRCLSARSPNGAAAMFRTALAYIVDDKGSAAAKANRNLDDKLKQLTSEGGPVSALADWTTHVRLYGNAGAHPDVFGDVSMEEAREVSRLIMSMLELLYVLPARIKARRLDRGVQN